MPESEQNKKMDGLLRAYAKRPRPGMALHPVSRRALQEEVKTVYGGGEERTKKARVWPAWWIRWPAAVGLAAWAVMLVVSNRRYEEGQMRSWQAANVLAAKGGANLRREPEVAAALPPAAAPMSTAPSGAASANLAGKVFGGAEFSSQQLFQNAAPAQQVLNNFQVSREEGRVVVTDGDGSVYAGNVVSKPQVETAAMSKTSDDLTAGEGYAFSVQGMNRSIQQAVSFNGSLVSNAGAAGNNRQMQGQGRAGAWKQGAAAQVSGMVTVGGTNQYKVQAAAGAP